MEEHYVFQVEDRYGQIVRLRRVVYERHLPEHPEMADYEKEAQMTIAEPDVELLDEVAGEDCHVYCRFGLGRDDLDKCWVKVPVYYDEVSGVREGEVATFYFSSRVGRGKKIWQRS